MKKYILALLMLGIISITACSIVKRPPTNKEKVAIKAAETWLELVDNEEYEQSWEETAGYFKMAVSKGEWNKKVRAVRRPLGNTLYRELKSHKYFTSLPGAPDGEYVVIQYKTRFENKEFAIETITPMLDKDGSWRVSGYYIK